MARKRTTDQEMSQEVVNAMTQGSMAASLVRRSYELAKTYKQSHEDRMLKAYNQWRGNYSEQEAAQLAKLKEKNPYASEAFIKVTKTKVLAAFGQLEEVLFANGDVPIGVEETPEPEGAAKNVYVVPKNFEDDTSPEEPQFPDPYGYEGDGKVIEPGTKLQDLLGSLTEHYKRLVGQGGKFRKGPNPDKPNLPDFNPAREAAERMESVLKDQLCTHDVVREFRKATWSTVMYGTGIVKGPFTYKEMIPKWKMEPGKDKPAFSPCYKVRPYFEAPSVFDVFPDPFAKTVEDMSFIIERHRYTKTEVQQLKNQNGFIKEAIDMLLSMNTDAATDSLANKTRDSKLTSEDDRYEVLEFWGAIEAGEARAMGITGVNDNLEDHHMVNVCLWVSNNLCLRKQINPFIPERIPYNFIPYEWHPDQIWGLGVPENMEDAQRMINVHTRAAQDNLRLAGSVMLEVNETTLVPGQDNSIYAGKVWRKQGGAPGQAIYPISFNSTAPQHFQFIAEANKWADQSTGINSYSYGMTGVQSIGRTAGGLSMLLNASATSIKTVVRNFDDFLFRPVADALFAWNMQFNSDNPGIRGDYKIVPKGVTLLMQKEVQSQRLLSFMQISMNPMLAPFVNVPNLIRQLAKSMDLDPEEFINDPDEAKLFAQILGAQANVNYSGTGQEAVPANGQGQPGGNPAAGAGTTPTDPRGTGNGTIGVGTPAVAGETSFTASA